MADQQPVPGAGIVGLGPVEPPSAAPAATSSKWTRENWLSFWGLMVLALYTFVTYKQLAAIRPSIAVSGAPTVMVNPDDPAHGMFLVTIKNAGTSEALDVRTDLQSFRIEGVDPNTQVPQAGLPHYYAFTPGASFDLARDEEQQVPTTFLLDNGPMQLDFRVCYRSPGFFFGKNVYTAEYYWSVNPAVGACQRTYLRPVSILPHGSCD